MKKLILYLTFSFFLVDCIYAQQPVATLKPGKYKIDGLEMIVGKRYPTLKSRLVAITDLKEELTHEDIIRFTAMANHKKAMKVVDGRKLGNIVREVLNSKVGAQRGRNTTFLLFPDKEGDITRIANIHAVRQDYDVTLEEFKKIFDRIKNEMRLAAPENVPRDELFPIRLFN